MEHWLEPPLEDVQATQVQVDLEQWHALRLEATSPCDHHGAHPEPFCLLGHEMLASARWSEAGMNCWMQAWMKGVWLKCLQLAEKLWKVLEKILELNDLLDLLDLLLLELDLHDSEAAPLSRLEEYQGLGHCCQLALQEVLEVQALLIFLASP